MDGKQEYRKYLNSMKWAGIRAGIISSRGCRCESCGSKEQLQVHHLRYPKVWGEEKPEDLQVLCRKCHCAAHGIKYKPDTKWHHKERNRLLKEKKKGKKRDKKKAKKRKPKKRTCPKERAGGPVRINEAFYGNDQNQ
jgi:hypothetical protein